MVRNNQTTQHYYTPKPASKLVTKTITTIIQGNKFIFVTASSVFSHEKIDLGTRILLENITIQPNSSILDLGCGYGVVGIVIAKTVPNVTVTLTDVNERATETAKKNAKLNHVTTVITTGNLYETVAGQTFDYVLLNPPQTAGRDICITMIEQAPAHLKPNGTFYLVARHKKGGEVLSKKMETVFGNSNIVARESGFRVYKSIKH